MLISRKQAWVHSAPEDFNCTLTYEMFNLINLHLENESVGCLIWLNNDPEKIPPKEEEGVFARIATAVIKSFADISNTAQGTELCQLIGLPLWSVTTLNKTPNSFNAVNNITCHILHAICTEALCVKLTYRSKIGPFYFGVKLQLVKQHYLTPTRKENKNVTKVLNLVNQLRSRDEWTYIKQAMKQHVKIPYRFDNKYLWNYKNTFKRRFFIIEKRVS